jgi:hypothetical protein
MVAAATYATLVSDLESYLQRSDALIINQIPRFILLAQLRIPRELKLLGFRTEIVGIFDGTAQSTGIMAKPSDWRKTIGFYIGTGTGNNTHTPVFERTYEYIRAVYPDPTVQGNPSTQQFYYADADYQHWLIGPSPNSAYPFKIDYYGTLSFLDETTQTNWLTTYAYDLLLYACLMEAIPFVKTDERIPVWQSMYAQAKQAFQMMELEGLYDTQAIAGEPENQPSPTALTPPPPRTT